MIDRVTKETGATPFDTPGAELGHHGELCSFDAIIAKYKLRDEALAELATIVRAADTQTFSLAPESVGLAAIAEGAAMIVKDDHDAIEKGRYLYDALYAYCKLERLRKKYAAEIQQMSKAERRSFMRGRLRQE